jgi:hypothetical protein
MHHRVGGNAGGIEAKLLPLFMGYRYPTAEEL